MVTVGELAWFEGDADRSARGGSAFAKASADSEVRFQLSVNALDLSTYRLNSVC